MLRGDVPCNIHSLMELVAPRILVVGNIILAETVSGTAVPGTSSMLRTPVTVVKSMRRRTKGIFDTSCTRLVDLYRH